MQARLSAGDVVQLDADARTLGLQNRSEAVRAALRLLHRHAARQALAREYDEFYGSGQAPVSDVTEVGDKIAVDVMRPDDGA